MTKSKFTRCYPFAAKKKIAKSSLVSDLPHILVILIVSENEMVLIQCFEFEIVPKYGVSCKWCSNIVIFQLFHIVTSLNLALGKAILTPTSGLTINLFSVYGQKCTAMFPIIPSKQQDSNHSTCSKSVKENSIVKIVFHPYLHLRTLLKA